MGGVITNTVQDRGARCRGSVVPPLPNGDGGVTDRATRGACSAGSGVVRRTTSLGLRSPRRLPSPSLGFMWDRTTPGWASPSISVSCFPCTCRRWRERDEWSWDGLLLANHSQVLTYPPPTFESGTTSCDDGRLQQLQIDTLSILTDAPGHLLHLSRRRHNRRA